MLQKKVKLSKALASIDDPKIERDIIVISKKYLKGKFTLDVFANFPWLYIILIRGIPEENANEDYVF